MQYHFAHLQHNNTREKWLYCCLMQHVKCVVYAELPLEERLVCRTTPRALNAYSNVVKHLNIVCKYTLYFILPYAISVRKSAQDTQLHVLDMEPLPED
jgi:hypothetical protein